MNTVASISVVLAIVVLVVVWLFLSHMMSSRKDDARLKFLFDLMDAASPDGFHSEPDTQRNAAIAPEANATKPLGKRADELACRGISSVAQYAFHELPEVFAAALRGRAM